MYDKKYIDVKIGEAFKPSVNSEWVIKTTDLLSFQQNGKQYTFYNHSVVLVDYEEVL